MFCPPSFLISVKKRKLPCDKNTSYETRQIGGSFFLLSMSLVNAQTSGSQVEEQSTTAILNYAFATQLGSGIYRVNGRTAQIYRLAFSINLLSSKERRWGLRLRLPFTFGFYNFKIEDILETGIPDKFSTIALVPTLEFDVPFGEHWWLGPFGGFGVGNDFSTNEINYIFAAGIRSLAILLWNANDIRLGNRLVYSGYTNKNLGFVDDFGVFETGLDFRRKLGFPIGSKDIDGSIFAANYLYFISPRLIRPTPSPIEMRTRVGAGFYIWHRATLANIRHPHAAVWP